MIKISEFPDYGIDLFGAVWSKKYGKTRQMKINKNYGRYATIHLMKDGKSYLRKIHILMLETFVGKRQKGQQACHNNGDRYDNSLNNLRWDSPENNSKDRKLHGTDTEGEKNGRAKLKELQIRKIRKAKEKNPTITRKKLAEFFNISNATIGDILKKRTWKTI